MNEYWKILLKKQQERGKKGFTLPFLIGSQTHLPSGHDYQNIDAIVLDMVANNLFETCIRYCLDTNALIFEIRNSKNHSTYPTFKGSPQTNFSVAHGNNNLGSTVEEIINTLKEMYQDKIEDGNFSAQPNDEGRETVWGEFSSSENDFISGCFASL